MYSFIIPCYNEEKNLPESIKKLEHFFSNFSEAYEIIFVNDGSSDKTLEILHGIQNKQIKTTGYEHNRGKGYAVRYGAKQVSGAYLFFMDCDLSTELHEITNFLKFKNDFDIIIGSRPKNTKRSFLRKVLGNMGRLLTKKVLKGDFYDTQCGFKFFNEKGKDILLKTTIERFGFDFEILHQAKKGGLHIKEIPVQWKEGKDSKVGISDYFTTLKELLIVYSKK